jgi:hypothetical protein
MRRPLGQERKQNQLQFAGAELAPSGKALSAHKATAPAITETMGKPVPPAAVADGMDELTKRTVRTSIISKHNLYL